MIIDFSKLELCEECENEYPKEYMESENSLCIYCYQDFKSSISFWKKWEITEGGEDND